MRRCIHRQVFIVFWLAAISASLVRAESVERVRDAVDAMQRWLGSSERGKGWNEYLKTDALGQELQRRYNADAADVEAIWKLYAADHSSLTSPRFVAVREALQEWLPTLSFPPREELPQMLRDAKSNYVTIDPARLDESRQSFQAALANLDRFLMATDEKKAKGWHRYLRRDELQAELDSEEPPDFKILRDIQARLEDKYAGLQVPAFVAIRRTLRDYSEALVFSREEFRSQFEKTLDTLADTIEKHAAEPSHERASSIALRTGALERGDQIPELVNAIRHYYAQPNAFVQFSEALVGVGFEETLDETNPISENTPGGSVSGESTTFGQTSSQLVPNAASGEVHIEFSGSAEATTRTVSGPATIVGAAATKIDAQKRLTVNDPGIEADLAQAKCVTENTIDDILGDPAIAEQLMARARASLPQAEARTARQVEQQISLRIDTRVNESVQEVNQRYRRQYKGPLMRRDEDPPILRFRTDDDYLFASTVQAGDFQLAANARPPELTINNDQAIRLHDSFLNNYVEVVYGATTLTHIEVTKLAKELIGKVPERLQVTEDTEPWSISFVRRRPLTVVFDGGGYSVTLRGKRFSSGERRLGAMHITAQYQFEMTPEGPRRIRQGDIQIEPADFADREKKILSTVETAEKAVLQRRFEKLFPPVIEPEGLVLPGRWGKAGQLVMQELTSQNGWLVLGWRMPDPPSSKDVEEAPAEGQDVDTAATDP